LKLIHNEQTREHKKHFITFVHNPHLCSMQCDEIFVCEGFCTGGSALPAGGALWSMCIVADTGGYNEVLLVRAGPMVMTGSDLDVQTYLLQSTLCCADGVIRQGRHIKLTGGKVCHLHASV
jgi:hypothetical protein